MAVVGYIVQYSNEEDYTVYHGFMRLHRSFQAALEHAKDHYRGYLETLPEPETEIFEVHTPTKKECDERGSVVVFECAAFVVWIDCVVE